MRRSSAQAAVENGATSEQLKTHYNWRSNSMIQEHTCATDRSKLNMSHMLTQSPAMTQNSPQMSTPNQAGPPVYVTINFPGFASADADTINSRK